jgi:thiamine biosynthesis lipoprotein
MISADNSKSHSTGWLFFVAVLPLLLCSGCADERSLSRLSGQTMGTQWHVSYVPPADSLRDSEISAAIESLLESVNASMSTYRADSEISRFNVAAVGEWIPVSQPFYSVLSSALLISEHSRGAYDVTLGPLVDLWGFGSQFGVVNPPERSEVELLLETIGHDKLRRDSANQSVMKTSTLQLDFSSIAKGYAVDQIAEWFNKQLIDDFLVEVGGEVRLSGYSARGDAWRIAIEQPDGSGRVAQALALTDTAMATSGDYRNYFEFKGKRFSHSLDPHTGFPVEHDLVSVTVLHPSAAMADGWATALTVLGSKEAIEVAQEQGLAVYFIRREGEGFISSYSEAFSPYLQMSEDGA